MARPRKTGMDYFPLDVDMDTDTTIAYIEAKHGAVAFSVLVKFLMRVYRDDGYFSPWNDRESYVFARQVGVDRDTVTAIIEDAISEGMFDADLYARYGVLTSRGIQSRYIIGTTRRGRVDVERALLLAPVEAKEARNVRLVADRFTSQKPELNGGSGGTETPKGEERKVEERKKTKTLVALVVEHLNLKAGTKYKVGTVATARHIEARLNDGYTLDDLKTVVDIKATEWLGHPTMEKFLRPETLFGSKFESYLNERKVNASATRVGVGNGFRDGSELLGDGGGGDGAGAETPADGTPV